MEIEIILSTRNTTKIEEIHALLAGLPFDIRSLDDMGIRGKSPETGMTLEENALQKAFFAWDLTKKWSMSDDTGISIDSRNGWPGVHTATWAGDGLSTEEFRRRIMRNLRTFPPLIEGLYSRRWLRSWPRTGSRHFSLARYEEDSFLSRA